MQKKNPPRAARGDDDRLGSDQHEIPSRNFDRHNALAAAFMTIRSTQKNSSRCRIEGYLIEV
jgi:hypothetical protein